MGFCPSFLGGEGGETVGAEPVRLGAGASTAACCCDCAHSCLRFLARA